MNIPVDWSSAAWDRYEAPTEYICGSCGETLTGERYLLVRAMQVRDIYCPECRNRPSGQKWNEKQAAEGNEFLRRSLGG